ncbi:3-alpha,7-alpha,12-alpha-trihydroxy-5-beta-cholest-24-enoyl-CoA hydratase [Bradyrhizobium macuxiense]|uniref:3-alpha,7-alpha, 12-alpha-trihydroxy-5-beta-cholest-24-enoyl-CoA hydratase n=1 Tax=Bradyrhizobium macuxiense TaxID=1755647 RepID=A0A109JGQ0_9BRAD|nr:MaoC/PaaZ C-terminal domain-containing protein [Bradyrhizobium macuxiense]KWV48519.1 3-alpha,7-alpha,12-alpha-trihydroxy-5-beta-cholest-24-enoyl-CoA hydratase [Bradyrhizobium macuxiense]
MLAYDRLMTMEFQDKVQAYGTKDTILYAASVGLGADPLDRDQLKFVYEKNLCALPSMVHVLGMDGGWLSDPENGINLKLMLHGESGLRIYRPLPAAGSVTSRLKMLDIVDKGADKGALLLFKREVRETKSHEPIADVTGTFFLRGNGGFGGVSKSPPAPQAIPERPADASCEIKTSPQAALLYRLNGDSNPLHADPDIAVAAGFPRPILHGSCAYAVACHAVIKMACSYEPVRLRRFDLRFSAPVFPGETIRTEMWAEDNGLFAFRCLAVERCVVILNNGVAEVTT